MKIKVLQHHIEQGKKGSTTSCPIALALKEETGLVWQVGGYIYPDDIRGYGAERYIAPEDAIAFMAGFDSGESVEPCELDIPGPGGWL